MTRRRRLAAAVLIALPTLSLASGVARADHCTPIDNPDPIPGQNTTYCHKPPTASPKPKTPSPTSAPTTAPSTPAPTRAPVTGGGGGTRTSSPSRNTPEPTPFDIEVPEDDALETPEIVVDPGIGGGGTDFEVGEGEQTASASTWIFGFIVGFIVGGLAGRASWGLRRRRRQQIFG